MEREIVIRLAETIDLAREIIKKKKNTDWEIILPVLEYILTGKNKKT